MSNFFKKNISILIIEDDVILAMGLETTLENFGYEICAIKNNSSEAIKYCNEQTPDLILADINLNSLQSGIDAAIQIWQTKKIPIIFLTSYSDNKTINKCMQCEPYGYLIKPYKDEELNATIKMALHKHNFFHKHLSTQSLEKIEICENICFHKGKNILFVNEKPIKLTGNETKLLQILSDNLNEMVSFEKINFFIWREEFYDLGKLRTLIYRLKNKIGEEIIENVFETGYKLKCQ